MGRDIPCSDRCNPELVGEQPTIEEARMSKRSKARRKRRHLTSKWDLFPRIVIKDSRNPQFSRDGEKQEPMELRLSSLGKEDDSDEKDPIGESFTDDTLRVVQDRRVLEHLMFKLEFTMPKDARDTYEFLVGQAHMLSTSELLTGFDTVIREMLIDTWRPMVVCAIDFLFDYVDKYHLEFPGYESKLDAPLHEGGELVVTEEEVDDDPNRLESTITKLHNDAKYPIGMVYRAILTHETLARLGLNVRGVCFKDTGLHDWYRLPFINVPENGKWQIRNYNPMGHPSCRRCGKIIRLNYKVADDLWKIVGERYLHHKVCLECFLDLAEEDKRAKENQIKAEHFKFLRIAPVESKDSVLPPSELIFTQDDPVGYQSGKKMEAHGTPENETQEDSGYPDY